MDNQFYYENGYVLEPELVTATTWKEIYLSRFFHNLDILRDIAGSRILIPVKANAYGHGLIGIAQAVQNFQKDKNFPQEHFWLGVANLLEAITLRQHKIHIPILVLGPARADQIELYEKHSIHATLTTLADLKQWLIVAEDKSLKPAYHVKFDTGMGRLGILFEQFEQAKTIIQKNKAYAPFGIYSHLATADEPGDIYTLKQIDRFLKIKESLQEIPVRLWHLANSGGVLNYPESHLDMVRPGIALYGYYPSLESKKLWKNKLLQPIMEIKSRVSAEKELPADHGVSYGRTFITDKPSRMAVLPIGYGDGFPRSLSNQWHVIFNGQKIPIRGTVSMDQIVLEQFAFGPHIGDVVTVLGSDKEQSLWADEWADILQTISYEILCRFSSRVPMVYRGEYPLQPVNHP